MEVMDEVGLGVLSGLKAAQNAAPMPATVSDLAADTETGLVDQERWSRIHEMKSAGMPLAAIGRALDLDRKTVRRWLRMTQWRGYQRESAGGSLLAAHQDWLAERAAQVDYSARILFQELRASRGYTGGYDTVRNAVRPLRQEARRAWVTQRRFESAPGHQAQVDWGQVRARFEGGVREVHVFVFTLGFSRRCYAEGYEHQRMESLLQAHEHAFEHFVGIPRELLYDRMRTVLEGEGCEGKRWNRTFLQFTKHWDFEPRVCRAYRAQTKGKVESGVKYIKRNFMPGRSFRDLADFNEQLRDWIAQIADVRVHGTTHEVPMERFAREREQLQALGARASFLQAMVRERVVAEDWLVSIDTNRYSVPWRLIGRTVQVVRVGGDWQIRHGGQLVAQHEVLPGRYRLRVDPAHGPGPVARNARKRFATPEDTPAPAIGLPELLPAVEIRDLSVYARVSECAEVL